ncbi:MAG: hypothetical protein U5N58_03160 [Actinomycetota bacterium]|nr:hypothetical protein [Actinomycetota bacterium]
MPVDRSSQEGDLERAAIFIRDKIHQPYRSGIYPHSMELVNRLIDDYGIPAAISGSGPSVVAFFHRDSRLAEGLEFEGFNLIRTSIDFNGSMYY